MELLDFYADWCGPCQMLKPTLEEFEKAHPELKITRVNIDEEEELAEKYGKAVYAVVSNMSIAMERRDLLKRTGCLVCNQEETGLLFSENYADKTPEEMRMVLVEKLHQARIPRMVTTMGAQGAVYASLEGESGVVPAANVNVVDTTGCGDAFFAGVCIGLTYGKSLRESCQIGIRLASSVIATRENVCPRFLPAEFGLEVAPE